MAKTNWYNENIVITESIPEFLENMIKDLEEFDRKADEISYYSLFDAVEMQSKKEYNNKHISYETYTKILKKYGGIVLWLN